MDLGQLVAAALAEDLGERGDVTSLVTVPEDSRARGRVVARRAGVLAGRAFGEEVLRQMGVSGTWQANDGAVLAAGESVLGVDGPARAVLAAERTLLNGMSRLSGIATLTARYVQAAQPAKVLDTRKTTPGWRALEKQAVAAGGGVNHRMGLHDMVLVKDNHLAIGGVDLAAAVARAREELPGVPVEVEADDLDGVRRALDAGADRVLLDNMDEATMRGAVALCAGRAETEGSGGMDLDGVARAAACGVDYVSVGALTHSAPALDLALDLDEPHGRSQAGTPPDVG
ncbi:MAG: carboxylating nicotinate-nucleotide diphosphorylase [Thermoleophilia bacterium]|nr:carboxylating nicotinate-nucleotide diphosphorylase [Thermoleophilia bacterium]